LKKNTSFYFNLLVESGVFVFKIYAIIALITTPKDNPLEILSQI